MPPSPVKRDIFMNAGARAEWNSPRRILMHKPGYEVFVGVLHSLSALFEKPFSIDEAAKEHDAYIHLLREHGAEVYLVTDVLLQGTVDENGDRLEGPKLDALRRLASQCLAIDEKGISEEKRREKNHPIIDLSPHDLIKVVLMHPCVRVRETTRDTGLAATYEISPLLDLYFCRDQMITTANGVVIGRMHSEQRRKETEVMKFVLRKLDIDPIYEVKGDGFLEGGDFLPAGDVSFIGQGLRTNKQGIEQLLTNNVFGSKYVAVVKDSWCDQEEMHLDTYFNIISPCLGVLVDLRMDLPGKKSTVETLVDVYEYRSGSYVLQQENLVFQRYLEDQLHYDLIPVSREDQKRYAVNFLTVGQGKILGIDGCSDAYKQALAAREVNATWMKFNALSSGYGAAHCTTQVLLREDD